MMILDNATIDSITSPAVADGNGDETPGATVASGTRCTLDAPQRRHVFDVGAKLKDVTAVVYVLAGDIARPAEGAVLQVTPDDLPQQSLQIVGVVDRVHDGQSHFEILCKGAA